MKFWAQRKNKKLGPFTSREEALQQGFAAFKWKCFKDAFYTGYGEFGPTFDIRFHELKRQ